MLAAPPAPTASKKILPPAGPTPLPGQAWPVSTAVEDPAATSERMSEKPPGPEETRAFVVESGTRNASAIAIEALFENGGLLDPDVPVRLTTVRPEVASAR